jgi:hypothetical protein
VLTPSIPTPCDPACEAAAHAIAIAYDQYTRNHTRMFAVPFAVRAHDLELMFANQLQRTWPCIRTEPCPIAGPFSRLSAAAHDDDASFRHADFKVISSHQYHHWHRGRVELCTHPRAALDIVCRLQLVGQAEAESSAENRSTNGKSLKHEMADCGASRTGACTNGLTAHAQTDDALPQASSFLLIFVHLHVTRVSEK